MIITILFAGLLLILVAGIRCGFALDDLIRMAVNGIKKAVNVLSVLAIVGILTAMWRADGTIAYIVSSAAGLFKPSILIVTIFLMNCLVSFMTGTSFGTAATMGVISMTIAGTAGVNPVISGGAVISGCFFGDRCSLVFVTETNLFDNIRNMLRTAAVPFVLTCLIYGAIGLGGANQVDATSVSDVFAKEFQLNRWMILPAIIVLGLSMLRVDVKQSMTLSIVCAVILCVVFQHRSAAEIIRIMLTGYRAGDPVAAQMINGGGLLSMKKVLMIVCMTSTYSGIFSGTGMLDGITEYVKTISQKTGRFLCIVLLSVVTSMVGCNQTIAIMMTEQLGCVLYKEQENSQRAVDLEDSAVLISALIPWSIAGAVPAATIGAPVYCLAAACYLYLIPICRLVRKKNIFPGCNN